jgi:hypothetical protein
MDGIDIPTKRRVEISVGLPDMLEGAPVEKNSTMPHHDESYFLTFVDVPDEHDKEDGAHNSLSAQTTCLCMLKEATVAWLQGATEEEIQKLLTGRHEHGAGHE